MAISYHVLWLFGSRHLSDRREFVVFVVPIKVCTTLFKRNWSDDDGTSCSWRHQYFDRG